MAGNWPGREQPPANQSAPLHLLVHPRIDRIVMGRGRDAADVAMSTAFGIAGLKRFVVVTDEKVEGR